MKKLKSFFLTTVIFSISLLGCQRDIDIVDGGVSPTCDSFNKSDNLNPLLSGSALKIKVPVARFADEKRGISVVFLPTSSEETTLFWLWETPQGKWEIAQKQTVVRLQPQELDAQFLHRLYPEVFPKTVLFIALPQTTWGKSLEIQPVLEATEARWGKVNKYPIQITVQGMAHPFRGLVDKGDSGDSLPDHLNNVMKQVEAGSIYLPDKFSSNIQVQQPISANSQLCPNAGA